MKKIFAVVFGAFFAFSALAEVAPVYYEEPVEEVEPAAEEAAAVAVAPKIQPNPAVSVVAPAAASARAGSNIRRSAANAATARGNAAGSRAVSARAAVAPVVRAPGNAVAPIAGRPVASRAAAASRGGGAIQSRATGRTRSAANVITRAPAAAASAPRAPIAKNRQVQARAASTGTLYNAARVGTTGSVMSAGTRSIGTSSARASALPTLFQSNDTAATTTTVVDDSAAAEELAAKTEFCKAQYLGCMDGFCAVLDDNSGRCTCSDNINKYAKVEAALKQAAIDLQDIATKIKYLGLSKDDVNSLFKETEAEVAMNENSSTVTALTTSLENIKNLLIEPTTSAATTTGNTSFLDFSSLSTDNFDWSSFMMSSEAESIQNKRGKDLYETASTKCASILTSCGGEDVDTNLIKTNYDIEIDKQCVAYERALTDENDTMKATIRNANTVLQQARLLVAQNKNKYDIKGCVSAVDACMVDSFVCGDDYSNCLDKTGQYIIGGNIIVGSEPGETGAKTVGGMAANWQFGGAAGSGSNCENANSCTAFVDGKTVVDMVESALSANNRTDNNLATMLKERLGGIDSGGKTSGMCASVLNQCQNYTYTTSGTTSSYNPSNAVVKEYLIRTLQRIKGRQDEVMASYGESCRQDIISCFSKNGANSSSPSQPLTTAISACTTYLKTCASVNGITDSFTGDVAAYVCPAVLPNLKRGSTGGVWTCTAPTCPADATPDSTATIVGNGVNGGKAIPAVGCRCTDATHTVLIDGHCAVKPTP